MGGEIRIIGGHWKRTRLAVPDKPGLRPTPDRVRETLFNWLGQSLEAWSCVDAFAGTGALGLEAASRGAAPVQLLEQDADLVKSLHATVQRLKASDQVSVRRTDGVATLRSMPAASVDLVLLDPPFESKLFESALKAARPCLRPAGWLYLEAPESWDEARLAPLGYALYRHLKAGAVHAHLLQPLPGYRDGQHPADRRDGPGVD
ncbi:MAG: rRNA ((966)-N(2))-methyltransferase RsmD [Pseudomonadota bacterium]